MRRSPISWALLTPALILLFFWIRPQADSAFRAPLFHFYIVTFTSFAATVVSFLLVAILGPLAQARHLLAAVAFALMGTLFVVHGLATPGALIPASHPAVPAIGWAAWLTLFVGGVVFALAGVGRRNAAERFSLPPVVVALAVVVLLFISVVVAVPQWLRVVESSAGPWHRRLLFLSSLGVWITAAYYFRKQWQGSGNAIDRSLAMVATLLAQATVSMHLFPVWRLSWWLYHALLLAGFLLTAFVLFKAHERARQFRLVPYYLAASLILTALLALIASYLFNGFAQRLTSDGMALAEATRRARLAGLAIGSLTMGSLSAALLIVVRRADRIITARTEELAVAYRDLRRAEAMRDDLTQMIVHDLRTPLTAILSSLGLLRQLPGKGNEVQSGLQARVVDRTNRAAKRLERMIDDILTVGKIESGELTPQREKVKVATLLERHLDPFLLRAGSEGKALAVECPPHLNAHLDPELTGRMLENLVNNAFKYTTSGGKIAVSAVRENGTLRMSVRDNGQGIPDEFKEHVFGKFAQVPAESGESSRKGTGLGLAFCQLVVEAHGGRIWVEDSPEGGSDFRVSIPLLR